MRGIGDAVVHEGRLEHLEIPSRLARCAPVANPLDPQGPISDERISVWLALGGGTRFFVL